jgi:hypothetical protein
VLSLLCVLFQVQLSFVVNILNIFLVRFTNFSFKSFVTVRLVPVITGIITDLIFKIYCISLN